MRSDAPTRLRRRLADGPPLLGTWLTLGSSLVAEQLGRQSFDWLGVDLGDATNDGWTTHKAVQTVHMTAALPFVRVPRDDVRAIRSARELGAACVLLSRVEARADAEYLDEMLASDVVDGDRPLRAVMLETAPGLECAEAILSVPGIDACFILVGDPRPGAGGLPPGLAEPLRRIQAICRARGIIPGIQAQTSEQAARRIADGWRLVGLGSDRDLVAQAAADARRFVHDLALACPRPDSARSYEAGCAMLGPHGSSYPPLMPRISPGA